MIIFKYVDGKGNTILSDTNGVSFANVPTLNGYRFVEAVADGSSIRFVYAGAGDIITRYKEIDGEDLIHPVISNTDALGKKITGFDIVDRIVSANGDITYTYRRIDGKNATTDKSTWDSSVKASDKNKSETREKSNSSNDSDYDYITRYEDTDGKSIASDEKSNKSYADRKDISGYKYLETRTEDNVKTYVYEKLSEEEAKKQAESQASAITSTQPSLSNNTNSGSPTTSTQPSLSNNTNNGSTSGSSTINTTPDNKDVKSIKTGLGNIATSKTGMMYLLFSIATLGIVSAVMFRDKLGTVVKGFVKRIKK